MCLIMASPQRRKTSEEPHLAQPACQTLQTLLSFSTMPPAMSGSWGAGVALLVTSSWNGSRLPAMHVGWMLAVALAFLRSWCSIGARPPQWSPSILQPPKSIMRANSPLRDQRNFALLMLNHCRFRTRHSTSSRQRSS
jgi:hypothetical protein